MVFISFAGGILVGILLCSYLRRREKIHGIIHIDHNTEQMIVNITSNDLHDRKRRTAVFVVNHDANISQE